MPTRTTALAALAAFAFAAVALSGPASAATHHKTMTASKGSTASADNSADQLNATSLADVKSNTPYAPPAAPAATTPAKKPASKKM